MARSSARKNGHELAAAWLRRDRQPARDALGPRQQPERQAAPGEAETSTQIVPACDRSKGFFRA